MLEEAVREAALTRDYTPEPDQDTVLNVHTLLNREPGLADQLLTFHREHGAIPVDLIAVTSGPGLEPALWVGVNFAKAIATLWNVPVVPVNHMEGHIVASVFNGEHDNKLTPISFPALALLISGGHTELILMPCWGVYEKIGATRDDAVGEAYDKVARLLGLPYPGGPEVATRATYARRQKLPRFATLPAPMLNSGDYDFSFSGLKTAVRYCVADRILNSDEVAALCRDFEDVVAEVLIKKTATAVVAHGATTVIVGGGVSANRYLRERFNAYFLTNHSDVTVYFPEPQLATDNSIMIALSGHAKAASALSPASATLIRADGNRSL
jgi:N6-L-threonylcarbamoyladenine synthase